MKILVIGDQHFKDNLSYADFILDRRTGEKKEVIDFIIKESKDCDHIVLMGDNLNSKNNTSETNREFVEFVERFGKKQIYIMSGNHEKKGDGKTAIDFLGEIRKENWHIFVRPSVVNIPASSEELTNVLELDFLPYMLKSELGVNTNEEAATYISDHLNGGDILFAHHAITGFMANGVKTDSFGEPVLSKQILEEKYKLVVAGHVHDAQEKGRTVITGSVFTDIMGETEKFIWKIDENLKVEKIKLPCRPIIKFENPTTSQLASIPIHSIVKVVITDKSIDVAKLKDSGLARADASLIVEQYPSERKKMHIEQGAFDFSIEALLSLYAEEKGIDYQKLLTGLELIK